VFLVYCCSFWWCCCHLPRLSFSESEGGPPLKYNVDPPLPQEGGGSTYNLQHPQLCSVAAAAEVAVTFKAIRHVQVLVVKIAF
jgi:hypothetical protein